MASKRGMFVGRAAQLAAAEELAGSPSLLVVRGSRGSGRTAFLRELERNWRARGIVVHSSPAARVGEELFAEQVRLFKKLRSASPVAVFVDDVDEVRDPLRTISAAYSAGCTVVVTCSDRGSMALTSHADRVLDLDPLPEDAIGELLAQHLAAPLDEAVVPTVREALGPLAGNPGAVLAAVDALHRGQGFAEVLGHVCLRDGEPSSVALPREHHLVQYVEGLGDAGVRLVVLVATADRFGVDDVLDFADALGYDRRRCGEILDRLVAAGALTCDHHGRLSVPCPALTAALVRGHGADRVRAVHRAVARHLLHGAAGDPSVVAGHVALAGDELPADPALAELVEGQALRIVPTNQPLAARWFRAAVRHAEPGPGRVRLLRIALHLLLRTSQHTELAEVVAAEVARGAEESCRYELAAAAALAFVHIGRPVSAEIHDALAGEARARAALRFAERWFDEGDVVRPADVAAAFSGFRADGVLDWEPDEADTIEVTTGRYDVVAMLRRVLGPCFGEPRSGPLAVYDRLVGAYFRGEWSRVVSSARRLELSGAPTAMHHVARLLTAEVCSASGDFERARQWLRLAGTNDTFPALRTWAELGVTHRTQGDPWAKELGWTAYDRIRCAAEAGDSVGLPCFLVRLGFIEDALGDLHGVARAGAEARRWYERFGGTNLRTADLVLNGLSERDVSAVSTAVDLLRQAGNAAELVKACMAMAFLSQDPAPWFAEALEIANRLSEGWMGQCVKETMRKVGLVLPRYRTARDGFSDIELRIIALVQQGKTNRQIATVVKMSEKTVEGYLTRLFVRTGCRSRLDLAAASLEGRLVAGAVPQGAAVRLTAS